MKRLASIKQKLSSNVASYFLLVAISLTAFFTLWRLILLFFTWDGATEIPGNAIFGSFIVGLRFDFSIASYITIFLVIVGMLPFLDIGRVKFIRVLNRWLLYILAAITFLAHLADIEFFKFFNARLSGVAMIWKETPDYMAELVWETYPVFWYMLMYAVVLALFILLIRFLNRWLLENAKPSPIVTNAVWLIVMIGVLFVGGRGRIEGRAPLRWGAAYFSEYTYANLLALNPTFTFVRDAIYDAGSKEHQRKLMESIKDPDAEKITRQLLGLPDDEHGRIHRRVTFDTQNPEPPNVIIMIMESYAAAKIDVLNNNWGIPLSPCFDALSEEGVLFTNIYSNGMHTYGGLFSTNYGYPHMFGDLVMKVVTGQNYFWGLPHILREYGYQTEFYTTHDPHFDNMQGFFMANGVDRVYSVDDYGIGQKVSVAGVPDHVMFDYAVDQLKAISDKPFCSILLSGSNHGPWIIPDVPFEKVPAGTKMGYELNAFKYSDWSVGRFIRKLQADPAFENTLVVVTADNGNAYKPENDMPLDQYHIPLLFIWIGNDSFPHERVDELGTQMDVVATVMGRVGLDYDNYTFGRDLLDSTYRGRPFAHFTEWYRQGYIEGDYYCITRIDGPESLYKLPDRKTDIAAKHPEIVADYSRKSLAIYQTAYFNMTLPLHNDSTVMPITRASEIPVANRQ